MTSTLRERIETSLPSRERVTEAGQAARERAREAAGHTRTRAADAAEQTRARATEVAEEARERAEEVAEQTKDRAEELAETVGPLLARVFEFLSDLLSRLTARGRTAVTRVATPTSVRRRRRLRAAGWFAGGFTLGALVGWVLHARLQSEHQPPESLYGVAPTEDVEDSPYGHDAEAIDARRENLTG